MNCHAEKCNFLFIISLNEYYYNFGTIITVFYRIVNASAKIGHKSFIFAREKMKKIIYNYSK